MIHWTEIVRTTSTSSSFSKFIDTFIHLLTQLFNSQREPRIRDEIKRILRLNEQTKIDDWYLYQNYTQIRVYGFELAPYKFPKYVPMIIFSLEYIRQMINMDDLHFVSRKRKSQFKIKSNIGSFICKPRSTGVEADTLLKKMNFQPSFTWFYDPFSIIYALRAELKMSLYNHTPRSEIESS